MYKRQEVDFIVYGEEKFIAIEVKNSKQIRPKDLKGLQSFSQDYPEARLILLYRGDTRIKKDNIECIPVDDFLIGLDPNSNKT